MLPADFLKWSTVYGVFWRWRSNGTWQNISDRLREKTLKQSGKKSTPTASIGDSQSIRTTEERAENGYDAGKKTTVRKRHIAVDTRGLLLPVVIHSASVQDQDGSSVLEKLNGNFRRLKSFSLIPLTAAVGYRSELSFRSVGCRKQYCVQSESKKLLCCPNDGLSNELLVG